MNEEKPTLLLNSGSVVEYKGKLYKVNAYHPLDGYCLTSLKLYNSIDYPIWVDPSKIKYLHS